MHARIEGATRGLIAGIAGLVAMRLVHRITRPLVTKRAPRPTDVFATERSMSPIGIHHQPEEDATHALARIAYEKIKHRPPPEKVRSVLARAIHVANGLLVAAIYGALQEPGRRRDHAIRSGALFGTVLWLAGDELALPLLGLTDKPTAYHPSQHAQALAGHLGFGVATAAAATALGRMR